MVNYFDNEANIMDFFRETPTQSVWFPVASDGCIGLFTSLSNEKDFAEWINSSGKADPPPDYYNPRMKMMMDIMRVDDHGHVDERGKFINPVNERESKIQRQLREFGILENFPNVQFVFVNAITDLPGKEDHNYQFYLDNFSRTVEKHIKSIPLYKKNHPGYKTVFFVFDESSGYVIAENASQVERSVHEGEMFFCSPYLSFMDRRFVEIFKNSDIDYLIWYSPFKHFDSDMPELPAVCVYDVQNIDSLELVDYPETLIMSTEE